MSVWTAEDIVAEIGRRVVAWTPPGVAPIGLGADESGAALLLSQLSEHDGVGRSAVHDRLVAVTQTLAANPSVRWGGLYNGLCGLAFVVKMASGSSSGYATLRNHLDAELRERLNRIVHAEQDRLDQSGRHARAPMFDVISGATGMGRYFLVPPIDQHALGEVLRYLVLLTESNRVDGLTLPGWYGSLLPDQAPMLDLGLAHGIAGPLALLSMCWSRGHRVPGQDVAIRRIAEWLMSWIQYDDIGPYWPGLVTADEEVRCPRPRKNVDRPSWCYGAAGVARAVQLAAFALGENNWTETATHAMHAIYQRPGAVDRLTDTGLCHGLAGLAQVTTRFACDATDPVLAGHVDEVVERIRAGFDPTTTFGYPRWSVRDASPIDSPAFLEGASGIALALHAHANAHDVPRWESALLIS